VSSPRTLVAKSVRRRVHPLTREIERFPSENAVNPRRVTHAMAHEGETDRKNRQFLPILSGF
jgi:hypothetical protein